MSVDTNTKHKNLEPYRAIEVGAVRLLVAPGFDRYCESVHLHTRRGVLGRRLGMATVHRHGPACRH